MDFTIYTAGSAEFLEIILNSSAMITGSGSTADLARIGALLGILLAAFMAAFKNQAIGFQTVGVCVVLYMIFFGPTATVVIEDTVSGDARVVDNVSLGPAFIGSVISTISYDATRTSEQAFSTPGMTQYGLFSSLNTLARVRDSLRNPLSLERFQNFGKSSGMNLPKSLDEYLTYCTLNPAALRNDKSIDDLFRAGSAGDIFTDASTSQYVYVYDGTAGMEVGALKSCAESKAFIDEKMKVVIHDVFEDILNKGFSQEQASGRISSGPVLEGTVNEAINSFAITNKNAQEYVATSLIAPIFNDARVNALEHWQEQRAAMALRESLNQQEIQWAGKGDTFKHYMRPMIAFFEGMVYALTPFMAFALVLGGPGLNLLGKYLVLPLTIGLWMPLLSIVNAFTLWYAGSQIDAVLNGYDPTGTGFAMLQVMDLDHAIGKALGIGGLLAASVPPLALFIVSGSAMVANSVMSQATAGDKFKSEDVLPKASQPAPVLSSEAMWASDQMSQGVGVTGANKYAETLSAGQGAAAAVESRRMASESATQQYQQSLQSAVSQLASTTEGRQTLSQLGTQMAANLNLSSNATYSEAASKLESLGYSKDEIAAGVYSASAGASVPFGIASGNVQDTEQFKKMSSTQQQEAVKYASQLSQAVEASSNEQTSYSAGQMFMNSAQAVSQVGNTDSLSQSLTSAQQAQNSYTQAARNEEKWAAGQNLDLKQAAVNSLSKGSDRTSSAQALAEMASRGEGGREAFNAAYNSESIRALSADNNEQVAMAAIRAMNQTDELGTLVTSEYSPFDFSVNAGGANDLSGLSVDSQRLMSGADGIEARFASARGNAAEAYASESDMSSSGKEALDGYGASVVSDIAANNSAPVQDAAGLGIDRVEGQDYSQNVGTPNISLDETAPAANLVNKLAATLTGKNDQYHENNRRSNGKAETDIDGNDVRPSVYPKRPSIESDVPQ